MDKRIGILFSSSSSVKLILSAVIAVAFLKPEDYVHPENFDASKHDIHFAKLNINDFSNLLNAFFKLSIFLHKTVQK